MILDWIRSHQIPIVLTCVVIICVCLPLILYANANLPELVERNVRDSVLLPVEMEEDGYDFIDAKKDHAYILRTYLGRMKERNFSLLLRVLYPELSPGKQLGYALGELNLGKRVTRDQAENEIKNARETVARFVSKSRKFSALEFATFEHEDLPEGLLEDAKRALDESREYVRKYGDDPNVTNAEQACRKNRIAIGLAYLVRCAYQHFNSLDDELRQFRGDINRTIYYNDLLRNNNADALKDDRILDNIKKELEKDNELLKKYTESEVRRLDIVDAILDKDNRRAESLLRNTIIVSSWDCSGLSLC